MGSRDSGRNVPPSVRKLLQIDEELTKKFCLAVNKSLPLRALKIHYKFLEVSCHGILWLVGWLVFIYFINSPNLYQMQVNFYIGLIIDIILVAVIKAYVRRRRPAANTPDMFLTIGPDVYGFPSGHASRAAYIVHFFMVLFPLPIYCFPPLLAWSTSICISRVLLQRHHLLDVFAGIFLGIFEGFLIGFIWLSQGISEYCLSWLTDEQVQL